MERGLQGFAGDGKYNPEIFRCHCLKPRLRTFPRFPRCGVQQVSDEGDVKFIYTIRLKLCKEKI